MKSSSKNIYILGIETTCDDTSAAVVKNGRTILSNIISTQAEFHKKYGGIVPEIASRKHFELLPIVTNEALKNARLNMDQIDAVAVSKTPGLPPALSIGYGYASGLSCGHHKKLIEVDHLEAHISGIWLKDKSDKKKEEPIPYPYICLLVSGGHTEIRLVSSTKSQKIIGKTRDDAAGEAFDKVARILGLDYPGGPIIDKLSNSGDPYAFSFPRPMIKEGEFDFSFSGLKTAVKNQVSKLKEQHKIYNDKIELQRELNKNMIEDISASFQEAIVDTLVTKTMNAALELGINVIALAGGVSANRRLREKFLRECIKEGYDLYYPKIEYCQDNAAMVAARGYELFI